MLEGGGFVSEAHLLQDVCNCGNCLKYPYLKHVISPRAVELSARCVPLGLLTPYIMPALLIPRAGPLTPMQG